jgi:hypothetical protein
MRHVRDVIRLKSAGMPSRETALRVGTAASTVRLTIRRFEASGLTWPLPDDITDTELEARLFASAGAGPGTRRGRRQAVRRLCGQRRAEAVSESKVERVINGHSPKGAGPSDRS